VNSFKKSQWSEPFKKIPWSEPFKKSPRRNPCDKTTKTTLNGFGRGDHQTLWWSPMGTGTQKSNWDPVPEERSRCIHLQLLYLIIYLINYFSQRIRPQYKQIYCRTRHALSYVSLSFRKPDVSLYFSVIPYFCGSQYRKYVTFQSIIQPYMLFDPAVNFSFSKQKLGGSCSR